MPVIHGGARLADRPQQGDEWRGQAELVRVHPVLVQNNVSLLLQTAQINLFVKVQRIQRHDVHGGIEQAILVNIRRRLVRSVHALLLTRVLGPGVGVDLHQNTMRVREFAVHGAKVHVIRRIVVHDRHLRSPILCIRDADIPLDVAPLFFVPVAQLVCNVVFGGLAHVVVQNEIHPVLVDEIIDFVREFLP